MNTYTITLQIDGQETTQRWSGYTEQVAIAQCFLYNAQQGARALQVMEIKEKKISLKQDLKEIAKLEEKLSTDEEWNNQ